MATVSVKRTQRYNVEVADSSTNCKLLTQIPAARPLARATRYLDRFFDLYSPVLRPAAKMASDPLTLSSLPNEVRAMRPPFPCPGRLTNHLPTPDPHLHALPP